MYLLIDASCNRYFTHNSSYMQAYAREIRRLEPEVYIECWIGESADSETIKSFEDFVCPFLRSPIYSFDKSNKLLYFRDKIINKIFRLNENLSRFRFLNNFIHKQLLNFYLNKPKKGYKNLKILIMKLMLSYLLPMGFH